MSLLKRLFGSNFEPKTINVPGIGTMSNDKHGQWHGVMRISFLDKELDLTINTEEVSDVELELINRIEENFEKIHQQLKQDLFEDIEDFPDGTTMEQVFESLSFDFIHIRNPTERKWGLSATSEFDDNHIFDILFTDLELETFLMDG